jgi:hypothetical protein
MMGGNRGGVQWYSTRDTKLRKHEAEHPKRVQV